MMERKSTEVRSFLLRGYPYNKQYKSIAACCYAVLRGVITQANLLCYCVVHISLATAVGIR